jgi:hypothetical protein
VATDAASTRSSVAAGASKSNAPPPGMGVLEQLIVEAQRPLLERLDRLSEIVAKLEAALAAPRPPGDEWLSVGDIALEVGKSAETVRKWIDHGHGPLKGERWGNGREWRVRRSALEAFLGGAAASQRNSDVDVGAKVRKALSALNRKVDGNAG